MLLAHIIALTHSHTIPTHTHMTVMVKHAIVILIMLPVHVREAVCFSGVRPVYPSRQRLHDPLPSVLLSACMYISVCVIVCYCVSGGSWTASCTLNMPRESLASQDRGDREKTSFHANTSMLTRAAHTCLFMCV